MRNLNALAEYVSDLWPWAAMVVLLLSLWVSAAIEARLFGAAGALTVNERAVLGRATFRVADLVTELGRVLATREGGADAGVATVAGPGRVI